MGTGTDRQDELRRRFGFRDGDRGIHSSRSMMLADLNRLFEAVSPQASKEDYRQAIADGNVLGKQTDFTRRESYKKLHTAYGLQPELPVFRLMRFFWYEDPEARPLLALLCAAARDPLLRRTIPLVLGTPHVRPVERQGIDRAINEPEPGRFSATSRSAMAARVESSWTQSGHLTDGRERLRARPAATPAAAAYALALGYLEGTRGEFLFETVWARLLDRDSAELRRLAREAARHDWLDYRAAGGVTEVRFPRLFTPEEQELLREQG